MPGTPSSSALSKASAAYICSRYAWGRLYTNKFPVTAIYVLNEDVLPFFEKHEASITKILSDNGREVCGRSDKHPYELFLQLEGVKHRKTKVRRLQSNGFVEWLHRKLLDEHFRIEQRKTWYETVEQMQKNPDAYLHHYNRQRTHHRRNISSWEPYQTFIDGLPKSETKNKKSTKEPA